MTREGTRPLAALVVAVLAAALLAACGSSDSSSSSSTSAANPPSGSTTTETKAQNDQQGDSPEKGQEQNGHENPGQGQSGAQSQAQQGGGGSSGESAKEVETPLKVSGGGSAQFRTKGGDNSIQEFGDEADESELREAAEVVHGFYVSRAAEEWDKACSYLAKANIEQLEQLVSRASQSKATGCAAALAAFTQPLPAAVEREITTVDAGSLRHEGEQGFLIFFGANRVKYSMPLRDEGGTWKVTALSATTLG